MIANGIIITKGRFPMTSIKKSALAGLCAIVALSTVIPGAIAAPIVTDGGFANGLTGWLVSGSDGTSPGAGLQIIATPGTTTYGDTVGSFQGSTNAAYFVDDAANETISQTITLSENTQYTLSYALFATTSGANNPFSFTVTSSVTPEYVLVDSLTNQTGLTQVPVGTWTNEAFTFTTDSSDTSYNLAFNFISGQAPAKDLLLTDISIPEPASLALLSLGMIAMGVVGRRQSLPPTVA